VSSAGDELYYSVLRVRNVFSIFVVMRLFNFFRNNICRKLSFPVILRHSPNTVILNSNVILSSHNSEEPFFAPVSAPRVSNSPVFLAVFLSPANYGDLVIWNDLARRIFEHPSGVVMKLLGRCNGAGDRTSLKDLLHHLFFASDAAPGFKLVDVVLVDSPAAFSFCAVSAS